MSERLLSTAEAAERLRVDQATARRYFRDGKIAAHETPGGHYRVAEAAIDAFLRGQTPITGPMILAVANQKGGVGKTTTAAALGAAAADAGVRVLLVDWDPQASLTTALGQPPQPGIYEAIRAWIDGEDTPALPVRVLPGGEHLVPGHLDLAAAEVDLGHAEEREKVLRDLLEPVLHRYDLVIIDCGPTLGLLAVNAFVAATHVLIPVTPEYLAAQGLVRLGQTLTRMRRRLNRDLQVLGVLPTMVKAGTRHHQEVLEQISLWSAREGIPMLATIPDTIKAAEAAGAGVALTRHPDRTRIVAAQVYHDLAQQFIPHPEAVNRA